MEKFWIYGYNRTNPQEPGCTGFPGREISCITVDYRTEGVLAVLEVTFFCYSRTENVCVCIARDRNERETCSWWSSLLELTRLLHEIFQINIKFMRGLELASGDPFMREFIQALRCNQVPTLKGICKEYAYVYGKFKLCNLNSLPTESFKETLLDFPTEPGFLSGCCLSRKFRNMVYHTIFGRQTQPYRLFLPITEQGRGGQPYRLFLPITEQGGGGGGGGGGVLVTLGDILQPQRTQNFTLPRFVNLSHRIR